MIAVAAAATAVVIVIVVATVVDILAAGAVADADPSAILAVWSLHLVFIFEHQQAANPLLAAVHDYDVRGFCGS